MISVQSRTETKERTEGLLADPDRPVDAIIFPATHPLSGLITAQPSKNYTTRLLLVAALADGESIVRNCATSDDARAMQRCLRQLGASIDVVGVAEGGIAETLRIRGVGGKPRLQDDSPIDVGNAGAVLRLLLGISALLPTAILQTNHVNSLGKRPNSDLLKSLDQLGCRSESREGMLPITLHGGRLHGGRIQVSGARSSQFLSSLLFLAPLVGEQVVIEVVDGLVSKAPVRQTLEVIGRAGVHVQAREDLLEFIIEPQQYQTGEYEVNGDWPGSAAILAAAAVTGGEVTIDALRPDEQGEKECIGVLQQMGAAIRLDTASSRAIVNPARAPLRGINFDGDLATDAVLALIGAASLAAGRMRVHNVSNLRIKECDRISEPIQELRKLGVHCWEGREIGDSDPDAIVVEGEPAGYTGGVELDGRGDHRVIMMLSIAGLCCKHPVHIRGAHHIAKSYPAFFQHLVQLGAEVKLEKPVN